MLILALIGAGVVCAFQIGKAPPALPAIRDDLGLDLVFGGWIIAIYAVVSASLGIVGGALSDAAGHRRSVLFGLVCISAGSLAGGFALDGTALLVARFVESIGYLPIVISVPALISRSSVNEGDRRLAVGGWGAFMPTGTASMMLIAPVLLGDADIGWRGLWIANGVIAGAYAVFLTFATRDLVIKKPASLRRSPLRDVRDLLRSPAPFLLGIFYGTYTGNYLAVFGFLPTMLIDELGVTRTVAAVMTAIAVALNIIGNVLGGWLRKRNVSLLTIHIAGCLLIGTTAIGIFSGSLSGEMRYALAVLYSTFCGIIPGATLGSVAALAPRPDLAGTAMGWLVQGGAVGSLVLPPLVALAVSTGGGWQAAPWVVAGASVVGMVMAVAVAMLARRDERTGA